MILLLCVVLAETKQVAILELQKHESLGFPLRTYLEVKRESQRKKILRNVAKT